MRFDFVHHLGAVKRTVSTRERDGKPVRCVTVTRNYETGVDDLWDAVTNPKRLSRWFSPVDGDLRSGGQYQIVGNAGGTITACEPPTRLSLTWEFGADVSWVEVRLQAEGPERAHLGLTHSAHPSEQMEQFGPGAAGVGWEWSLMELARHLTLRDAPRFDEERFVATPEGKAFVAGSSDAWGRAAIASGEVAKDAMAAAQRTRAFFVGETHSGA